MKAPIIEMTIIKYFKSTKVTALGDAIWMPFMETSTEFVDQTYFDNVLTGANFFKPYGGFDMVTDIDMTNCKKTVTLTSYNPNGCQRLVRKFVFYYEEVN